MSCHPSGVSTSTCLVLVEVRLRPGLGISRKPSIHVHFDCAAATSIGGGIVPTSSPPTSLLLIMCVISFSNPGSARLPLPEAARSCSCVHKILPVGGEPSQFWRITKTTVTSVCVESGFGSDCYGECPWLGVVKAHAASILWCHYQCGHLGFNFTGGKSLKNYYMYVYSEREKNENKYGT